jgi:hypothetical protein
MNRIKTNILTCRELRQARCSPSPLRDLPDADRGGDKIRKAFELPVSHLL